MDFIERWFGISPDGGTGTSEVIYVLCVITVVVALVLRKYRTNSRRTATRAGW